MNAKYQKQNSEVANSKAAEYPNRKNRFATYLMRKIPYRIISNRKIMTNKISMERIWKQNIEWSNIGRKISKCQKIERKLTKGQNVESKISKNKASKWHNIEREDVEQAKCRPRSPDVAKYRTQIIEVKNIESKLAIMQKIRLGRDGLGQVRLC